MFIIKRFRDEKIVKFVVSFLLCVLFLLSSLSVLADEEPTTVLSPPATQFTMFSEQQTELPSEQITDVATQPTMVSEQQTELPSEQITDVATQPIVSTQSATASEQQTELPSEQITDFILTDSFTSSDYQLITVILLLVLIFVFLLKFIL